MYECCNTNLQWRPSVRSICQISVWRNGCSISSDNLLNKCQTGVWVFVRHDTKMQYHRYSTSLHCFHAYWQCYSCRNCCNSVDICTSMYNLMDSYLADRTNMLSPTIILSGTHISILHAVEYYVSYNLIKFFSIHYKMGIWLVSFHVQTRTT